MAGCLIGVFNLTLVTSLRYQIPLLFTADQDVIDLVGRAMPVCAAMQVFDSISAVANGLLRGLGRQEVGGYANLVAYYAIALPISFGTAFGLGWNLAGLWFGVSLGLFVYVLPRMEELTRVAHVLTKPEFPLSSIRSCAGMTGSRPSRTRSGEMRLGRAAAVCRVSRVTRQ